MKKTLFAILTMLMSATVYPLEPTDVQRAAQIIAKTLTPDFKDEIRGKLIENGLAEVEAAKAVERAINDYSMCTINSGMDQARSQGISEDAFLKSLIGEPVTIVQEMEVNRFDYGALAHRIATCRKTMSLELGIELLSMY